MGYIGVGAMAVESWCLAKECREMEESLGLKFTDDFGGTRDDGV